MRADQVASGLAELECPTVDDRAWVYPAAQPKVSIVSTAGLSHRGEAPFSFGGADYRVLDLDDPRDIVMTHISTNFDRSGFAQDLNVVFPIDRLREMVADGGIGSLASLHYSFMGATDPALMEPAAEMVAAAMIRDEVDVAVLVPV